MIPPTAPNAVRIPAAVDSGPASTCAGPGCDAALPPQNAGRPARYCCPACRSRAHRARHDEPGEAVSVEVDRGSASSRGRHPDQAWMVRLRRGERSVVVSIGLSQVSASHLADHIAEVLGAHEQ